jgi:hypothetical protein
MPAIRHLLSSCGIYALTAYHVIAHHVIFMVPENILDA